MTTILSSLTARSKMFFTIILSALAVGSVSLALFASAEVGPEIITTIHNDVHSTIERAPIGSNVHARAILATTTSSTTPTGTVDFKVYSNTSCSGDPVTETGVVIVDGVAESATTSVGAHGVSYVVLYNGDEDNAPSEGQCSELVATAPNTFLATELSSSTVLVGTFVHDTAILSNKTSSASGTVSYTVFTNSACTLGAQSAGIKDVVDGSVPNSDSIQFNIPGKYYWQAVYSGNQNNSAATSSCASEKLTVLATSTNENKHGTDKNNIEESAGKHSGFVDGLPPGIAKKIGTEGHVIPPGIFKRFINGDFFKKLFHGEDVEDDVEEANDDNNGKKESKASKENKGRGKGSN